MKLGQIISITLKVNYHCRPIITSRKFKSILVYIFSTESPFFHHITTNDCFIYNFSKFLYLKVSHHKIFQLIIKYYRVFNLILVYLVMFRD